MKTATMALTGVMALALGAAAVSAQEDGGPHYADAPAPAAARPAPANPFTMPGYLPKGASPDSLLLNPAPPAAGSAAEARDIEAAKAAVALRGTLRWTLAARDADLNSPTVTSAFSCAAGLAIGAQTTPKLEHLMRRAMVDIAMSTGATKRKYMRGRPFMANNQPICTPGREDVLRNDGSYPSGHSALGWGWGLILAEAIPGRAAQLVARGRAFGDSRRICNVHWLSDIEEGRVVASAVVARLNAEPEFQADLAAARAEVAGLAATASAADCSAEAALSPL